MNAGALFRSFERVARRLWRGAETALRQPLSHPVQALVTVVTLVGGVISIALGMRELADWIGGSGYESETSRLVIVDSSAVMSRHFSPESKFDSATSQILRYARREPGVDVAIRFTSGRCDSEYTAPAVSFDHGNTDEIEAALSRQRRSLRGKADLADTFAMGLEDFHRSGVASKAKVRTIWLILGSAADGCQSGQDAAEAVKDALAGSPIGVTHVDFFALRTEQKSFEELRRRMEKIAGYVRVIRVANETDLRLTVEQTALRESASQP
jgi:hypothetical protein